MARFLALSSQVAHGHVGLSAIVPTLHALGHQVIPLPTVLLSNHPGHNTVAGQTVDPNVLGQMLDALAANGRLDDVDAVLTGYLPTVEHVRVAAEAVAQAKRRRPSTFYLCDPILGDDPKGLYIDATTAEAIKAVLVPLSDWCSPNRFELAWLSGQNVVNATDAIAAGRSLQRHRVFATSIPAADNTLLTIQIEPTSAIACRVQRWPRAPRGTGDFLSALLVAGQSLGQTVASVDAVIEQSQGHDELQLIASRQAWRNARPLPEEPIDGATGD